jgi:hypothetical protein
LQSLGKAVSNDTLKSAYRSDISRYEKKFLRSALKICGLSTNLERVYRIKAQLARGEQVDIEDVESMFESYPKRSLDIVKSTFLLTE